MMQNTSKKMVVALAATSLSVAAASCRGGAERLEAALARVAEAEFDPDAPGGAVLVARGDEVLLRAAYGLAAPAPSDPMRLDAALPIGSVTKSFTAGAVLQLVAEGRLELDGDVRDVLPDADTRGRAITIQQLLTHTSGLPNLVDQPDFMEWAVHERTVAELLALTDGEPLRFEPGEGFFYSDSGYILLGSVIEHITGMSYGRYVEERLAGPLGLIATSSATRSRMAMVPGWTLDDAGEWVRPPPLHMSVPHASGALASTVDDLNRWVRAWTDGLLVPPELVERSWAARELADGTPSGYGLGWKRCPLAGYDAVGHGGWVPGNTAAVLHVLEPDLTAAVLVNNDAGRPEASYVARRLLRTVLTGSPTLETVPLTPEQKAKLSGRYRAPGGEVWTFSLTEEAMEVVWPDDARQGLVGLSPSELAAEGSDGTWVFRFDLQGVAEPASAVRDVLSCEPRTRAVRVD